MKERGHYDHATVHGIIKECPFIHVAFVDPDGLPMNIPMIGAMVDVERDGSGTGSGIETSDLEASGEEETGSTSYIYLHGHAKSRLIRLLPHGTHVCLTATILDGLVLALVAFHHSMNYRSAVVHGVVEEIDEEEEEEEGSEGGKGEQGETWRAAKEIVEKIVPGRWDACRKPTKAEMKSTGFVKIRVISAR